MSITHCASFAKRALAPVEIGSKMHRRTEWPITEREREATLNGDMFSHFKLKDYEEGTFEQRSEGST